MQQLRAHTVLGLKVVAIKKAVIYADGASRGNPGPAAIGAVVKDEAGKVVATISKSIGKATNNQAEYHAVIAALEKAIGLGAKEADIRLDSQLVVRQLTGQYRVKNTALRPLYLKLTGLIASLDSFTIAFIPRRQNAAADKLANKALG